MNVCLLSLIMASLHTLNVCGCVCLWLYTSMCVFLPPLVCVSALLFIHSSACPLSPWLSQQLTIEVKDPWLGGSILPSASIGLPLILNEKRCLMNGSHPTPCAIY